MFINSEEGLKCISNNKDDNNLFPVTIATIPQLRMTRKIVDIGELQHQPEADGALIYEQDI